MVRLCPGGWVPGGNTLEQRCTGVRGPGRPLVPHRLTEVPTGSRPGAHHHLCRLLHFLLPSLSQCFPDPGPNTQLCIRVCAKCILSASTFLMDSSYVVPIATSIRAGPRRGERGKHSGQACSGPSRTSSSSVSWALLLAHPGPVLTFRDSERRNQAKQPIASRYFLKYIVAMFLHCFFIDSNPSNGRPKLRHQDHSAWSVSHTRCRGH